MDICRIVVGGCRDYNNYFVFKEFMAECLSKINSENIIILSGHCSGVDQMAEKYAQEHKLPLEIYPAEWGKYGRAAGPKRNQIMVENAEIVIAFWDRKSKGTKNLISCAEKSGKKKYIKYI
ncbi:MAG: DUF2493 domain-containing protein [Clostridia bacterium]|nr:DUF2493 domain-containing protein [Clostridia bacterium]